MSDKARTALAGIAKFALAIVILVVFVWTPKTGRGILVYAALIILLIAGIAVFSNRETTGYWPDKPADD